ncbi:MAG: hypothetical protein CMN87_20325 [Stappia sp.]|nr:hypothetical protein [Stappia sp.]MBM22354.1 hypothetical protein [Stappia sp.]
MAGENLGILPIGQMAARIAQASRRAFQNPRLKSLFNERSATFGNMYEQEVGLFGPTKKSGLFSCWYKHVHFTQAFSEASVYG